MVSLDLNSITVTDPYMFGTVFRIPELCKELLELVLEVPVERIVFLDEEQSKVPELGAKGIRMDVYVADSKGTVYNIEMQNANEGNLERRSRYYSSANDMDCVTRGMTYENMNDSYVVFICTFDPFARGRVRYTITPHCREDKEEMPDGTTRLFLNARAWEDCESESLKPFLHYLLGGTIRDSEFTKKVDEAVCAIRQQPEWRRNRMKLEMYLEVQRQRAIEEGIAQGLEQGRELGLEQGRELGLEQGRELGLEQGLEQGRELGLEQGLEQGRELGLEQGREEEQRLNACLAQALMQADRADELPLALMDLEVRQNLLKEFNIE